LADIDYYRKLDHWHCELAIVEIALRRVLCEVRDEEFGAMGHVLRDRLFHLVETCPFPEGVM